MVDNSKSSSKGSSKSSWLGALTQAILTDSISVETARKLVIEAHSQTRQEVEEAVELYPTAKAAAASLGISKATLYRRLERARVNHQ